ncbi:spermidine/putrescine transport system permease protein [Breoghania corrubedonensis]|uniref:Spermidine/putrescine transport system permease protein n=1 Tax=Breoghania corrubedonensis TaxID=665038 RepID=A0A2T5VBE6_9HYPH|nr:ABC transporter permease [Breoghania corrubedonensis]PTW61070.1 spermidine/putrescine transport system permease protein [Breoghania corrubedonensis]
MSKATGAGAGTTLYSLFFFAFLFGPLIIMVVTAFNSSSFPRITPWECFTTDWFSVLVNNARLMGGLGTSVIIGAGVVVCAVPIGLAGAMALSELPPRLRAALYTVLITPILIPGVVLGISTIVFWGIVGRAFGEEYASTFYNGIFLTLIGQITFISAYAMLVFSARLQRFDPTLTEAALDLGATPGQCFRKILLPFLKPAIGSAAFLTLLASFENYNTTVFTILSDSTFTTALASKVRLGTDPSLSALAVIIIGLTLIGAMVHEARTRRQALLRSGKPQLSPLYANPVTRVMTHPAGIAIMLIALAGLLVYLGSRHDASACKAGILQQKRAVQEQLLEEQRARIRKLREKAGPATTDAPATNNPSPFGGAFKPGMLAPKEETAPANPSPFGGAFKPNALKPKE